MATPMVKPMATPMVPDVAPSSSDDSIALTTVNDPLLVLPGSPVIAKNTLSMGNNVIITKSNIIIRKDPSDGDSTDAPWTAARVRLLAKAIEDVVMRSTSAKADESMSTVMDMLGVAPSSESFAAIRRKVEVLFQLRGDGVAVHKGVAGLLGAAKAPEELGDMEDSDSEAEEGEADEPSRQQQLLLGYRTLFRWSVDGRTYFGWRYPLGYWALYGAPLYGQTCGLGVARGAFFYC